MSTLFELFGDLHEEQQQLSTLRLGNLSGEHYQRELINENERNELANRIIEHYDAIEALRERLRVMSQLLFPTPKQ